MKALIEPAALMMVGVNGVGVGACNPDNGEVMQAPGDFVHCVVIFTSTQAASEAIEMLYPLGTKFKDVYVVANYVGDIVSQPRATSGN